MRRRAIFALLIGLGLLALAFLLDAPIAAFVHAQHWDEKHPGWLARLRETIKLAGFYPVTIVIAVVVGVIHPKRWRAGLFLLVATLPTALNEPMKFFAGRFRPFRGTIDDAATVRPLPYAFHPFHFPLPTIVHPPPNLSFPSGHTALAFATAAALSILSPRGRWIFFAVALVVGIERVTENAHWTSDAVCGALLGLVGVYVVARLWPKRLRN